MAWWLREALDPRSVQSGQRLLHLSARNDPGRGNLGEGNEHKGALEQTGMGQGQARIGDGEIAIGQQVDVEYARPPPLLMLPVAAERSLDGMRMR